jgi:acetylornithine deacetylase/succinyl-diaminopimelate desuccinylase-like protein
VYSVPSGAASKRWLLVSRELSGYNPTLMMTTTPLDQVRLRSAVSRERLLETTQRLIAVHSPTGEAGAVCDCLARILTEDGFKVERVAAGHAAAPAVVVRLESGKPGRTLQFNGHLDTVHLPFVPPRIDGNLLTGSGASDMKGGTAAAVEALRALRDAGALTAGGVLLTAHDMHEAPWGFGQQLDRMIQDGIVGDAVLLPEPLCDRLPIAGRGAATWKVTIRRDGPPVHEVMRPADQPSVIAAGAELVSRLGQLSQRLAQTVDPVAGAASVFIGQIHSGEIYNQYPQECWLEGTRRWLPGTKRQDVEAEFRELLTELEWATNTTIAAEFRFIRDAFALNPKDKFVEVFQQAYGATSGQSLPLGPKPFVDDGNSFYALAGVPAITHGPRAGGQHTVNEWVEIDDLVRIAELYARIAVAYCGNQEERAP